MDIKNIRVVSETGEVRRPTDEDLNDISINIGVTLADLGFKFYLNKINSTSFKLREVRNKPEIRGWRYSKWSEYWNKKARKARFLSWNDWVIVNNALNNIMDRLGISCNIQSLGGKFVIRKGFNAKGESEWHHLRFENVGSQMYPVTREEWYYEK